MTTTNYPNTGKLERMLDGIHRKVTDIGKNVLAMSERLTELVDTADAIYDVVTYNHESPAYRSSPDEFLEDQND